MPPPLKLRISSEQEELLWDRRIFSLHSSSGLLQAVIFYLIKSCGVYQGKDLRQLKTQHVSFGEDAVGNFVSIDFSSVACCGKLVRHYDDPNNPRSLYKLLKTYIRYLANEGAFLVRPISSIKDYICYSPWPMGVAFIEHMVQTLMEEAGQGSRYGNISANLLALDILKSYGAGRHCLAAWVDCLGGAAHCYKILSGRIPECSSVNCKDLNAEAGLIMSHLLDPPYPSSPSMAAGDLKVNTEEETENQNLDCVITSQTPTESPGENQNGKSAGSKPNATKERLRLVKRGSSNLAYVRYRAGMNGVKVSAGGNSSLHKTQDKIIRLKQKESQKNPSMLSIESPPSVSEPSDTVKTVAGVKTELAADERTPQVEIDVARDSQITANGSDKSVREDSETEELDESNLARGKRKAETLDPDRDLFCVNKAAKMEQHFQALESSLCSGLETFGDGVEQREDTILDSGGEVPDAVSDDMQEDGGGVDKTCMSGQSEMCNVKGSVDKSLLDRTHSTGQEENLQKPPSQKQEHLSLVSGLEQWLQTLKERVKTGANTDVNGLLLQATSQLKAISDQMVEKKAELPRTKSSSNLILKNGARETSGVGKKDSTTVETLLLRQLESVQQLSSTHGRKKQSPSKDCALELFSKLPSDRQRAEDGDVAIEVSPRHDEELTSSGEQGVDTTDFIHNMDPLESSCGDDVDDDVSSVDLSPPVLSPHPPADAFSERGCFLVNTFSTQEQQAGVAKENGSIPSKDSLTAKTDLPSKDCESAVPDLVKFLESANLQMQSLLSPPRTQSVLPPSPEQTDLPSQTNSSESKEDANDSRPMQKAPDSKAVADASKSVAQCGMPNSAQLTPPNLSSSQNQKGSWPLLRSVLEQSSLAPTPTSLKHSSPPVSVLSQYPNCDVTNGPPSSLVPSPSLSSQTSVPSSSIPLAAQSGMYTFHSDHAAGAAFQSLTVVAGDKRSQVFTFPDLPLGTNASSSSSSHRKSTVRTSTAGTEAARSLRSSRSELCLGDYLPRGAVVPARSVKVLTQQGANGLEVVLRFDFSDKDKSTL